MIYEIMSLWEIFHLWKKVIDYMSKSMNSEFHVTKSMPPWRCLTVVPQLNKCSFRILKTGFITRARIILRCWRESPVTTLNMWKVQMMGTVAGGNEAG